MASSPAYKDIAIVAQRRRAAAIPKDYLLDSAQVEQALAAKDVTKIVLQPGHFSAEEIKVLKAEAEEILEKIKSRTWSAIQIAQAFCKAAAVAQQLTNCITEVLFDEALARAQELDRHLSSTGSLLGPLHGLPISLKDCFITPPHPSSLGMSYYANVSTKPEDETLLVTMLRDLGAVAYVKTNVPVAMMMMETDNHVWGCTTNPHNTRLSAGGSSGGEAALIAMNASPLGIGTDIGGSVRIPAAWCGLYGLKPSFGRYPTMGTRSGIPGQEFILSTNGPIARSLETLQVYSAAVLSTLPTASPWNKDPKVVPIPWSNDSQIQPAGRPLRLGLVEPHDSVVHCHPPIERGLALTRDAVIAQGHEVVPWDVSEHGELVKMLSAAFLDFGATAIMPLLQQHNEPIYPFMTGYAKAAAAFSEAERNGQTAAVIGPTKLREINTAKYKLQRAYLERMERAGIDGIIMAVTPWTACRNGLTNAAEGNGYIGYTAWVNLLDLPSCTFPVTFADKEIDKKRGSEWKALSKQDEKVQADYDEEVYDGSPVALQLVGRRFGEEKVLEVVGLIRDALVAHGVN